MPAREFIKLPITTKLLTRIFSKIKVSESCFYNNVPCWEWTGYTNQSGYATFKYGGQSHHRVHRIVYQLFVEEIDPLLDCDHLCRNRKCINPIHIEPTTKQVNVLRGEGVSAQRAKQTHCKKGHKFNEENTKIDNRGNRVCYPCLLEAVRVNQRRYRQELKTLPYDHPRRIAKRNADNNWRRKKALAKKLSHIL